MYQGDGSMGERNEILVVVHPGSALGSADFNLGEEEASAGRVRLMAAMDEHNGDVLIIHGNLSDELSRFPDFQAALSEMIERNTRLGNVADEVRGDDQADHNQVAAIAQWVSQQKLVPDQCEFFVTGAWYHSNSKGGCVGSVVDKLHEMGFTAHVEGSVMDLDTEWAPAHWPAHLDAVLERGKAAGFTGFGGACFPGALALAQVLFPDQPVAFVGAFNQALHAAGRSLGHVAIVLDDPTGPVYLDADGRPKTWEDIESWGMLDPTDPDYKAIAKKHKIIWNDETASEVIRVPLTAAELEVFCEPGAVEEALRQLRTVPTPEPRSSRRRPR
jgi:hypothetical protein